MEKYKYFDVDIDDNLGLGAIGFAIVDDPAHESKAAYFNQQVLEKFSINEDKQVMTGALLIADKWIPRVNKFTKEPYFVRFTADKIESIAYQLGKNVDSRSINFDHTDNKADAFLFEAVIIKNDKLVEAFQELGLDKLPVGSLVVSVKFTNKEQFAVAKAKGGFSIEVLMDLILLETEKKDFQVEELKNKENSLKKYFNDLNIN